MIVALARIQRICMIVVWARDQVQKATRQQSVCVYVRFNLCARRLLTEQMPTRSEALLRLGQRRKLGHILCIRHLHLVCVRERGGVCVCVRESEWCVRERERERERERVVSERNCVCGV
jgi:hypothetical protein